MLYVGGLSPEKEAGSGSEDWGAELNVIASYKPVKYYECWAGQKILLWPIFWDFGGKAMNIDVVCSLIVYVSVSERPTFRYIFKTPYKG